MSAETPGAATPPATERAPRPGEVVPGSLPVARTERSWLSRRADRLIALALFLGVTMVTCAAQRSQGVHRDESVYMDAGERYIGWWEQVLRGQLDAPLGKAQVMKTWNINAEHPPLMKLLYGLSWRVLADVDTSAMSLHPAGARQGGAPGTLGLTSEITAFRAPTIAMFGLLVALVYLFFLAALGRRTERDEPTLAARAGALAAALLTACQPRLFFHAQTASFDLPAATMWFACVFAYWRAIHSRNDTRDAVRLGVLFGLFLATKLQSFFLPIALGLHWLWLAARTRFSKWPTLRIPIAMAVLSPLVLFALWPYLWHDTFAHLGKYIGFHTGHVHYNFEYAGTNYNTPPFPWHEPLGMLVTTAPVILLALAAIGIVLLVRTRKEHELAWGTFDPRATRALLLVAGLVPIAPFLTGRAPIFGETKHWLGTMPILALCAGFAVQALVPALLAELRLTDRRRAALGLAAALIAVCVVPALVETVRSHPYGLSHYNALAGGAPGGADLGMNRQFWGYAPQGLFATLDAELPRGAKLYPHDMAHDAMTIAQRDKRLRRDLVDSGMEQPGINGSQAALLVHELHFAKYDFMIWNGYGTVQPAEVLTLDGVPLVSLYRRAPKPAAPAAPPAP